MALVLGTNCGFVTEAPEADPVSATTGVDGYAVGIRHTSSATATKITEIGWWVDQITGSDVNFEIGIYEDNGSNYPGDAVAIYPTNAKGTSGDVWIRVSVDINISSDTLYWIVVQVDDNDGCQSNYRESAGDYRLRYPEQTTLENPFQAGGSTYASYLQAIYAVYETEVVGTNMKLNIADAWKDVDSMQINIGDVWKDVVEVQQNIGDVWKTVF